MTTSHSDAVAAIRINPGETLRKARENRNLSLKDVAAQLNLTPTALTHLEAGAFDRLPGHTFARGYIRAYAKLLGMDQNRLVVEFDHYTGTDASGSPVHSIGQIEQPVRLAQSLMRLVSVALLGLLVVAGYFWWQEQSASRDALKSPIALEHVEVESADGTTQIHPLDEPEDQAVQVAEVDVEVVQPAPTEPVAGSQTEAAPTADVAAPAPAVQPGATPVVAAPAASPAAVNPTAQAVAVVTPPAAAVTPQLEPAPAAVTPPPAPATPVAGPGEGLVGIRFTANCWVQLTDANGKVLFSALKRAGETVELAGKTPLELRLGYASGAQVSFNGQPVDVAPFTSGETARMKLGQ